MPRCLRVISTSAVVRPTSGATRGTSSPVCITSLIRSSRRRPRLPAGCERAKSSEVNPRASSKAMASASPSTSAAVVLVVGARPSGQASQLMLPSRCTSACRASEEPGLPVIAISGIPSRLSVGRMNSTSSVSPE